MMDAGALTPDVLHLIDSGAAHSIESTLRALRKAHLWCQPVAAVVDAFVARPLLPYEERRLVIGRLQDENLTASDYDHLRELVDALEEIGSRPGRANGAVFSTIGDVLTLLRRADRVPRCLRYLSLRKWQPRAMASRLLKGEDLSMGEVAEIVAAIHVRPQNVTIELAARNASQLSVDACLDVVLPGLESHFWRSRVIERLLERNEIPISDLADRWPMGTLWAVARNRWRDRLPALLSYLPNLEADWQLLPIVTWALGRLEAADQLEMLERRLHARPEWATHSRIYGERRGAR